MIRQAQTEDYEAIQKIKSALGIDRSKLDNRDYRVSLQKNGFVLFPNLEKSDFEQDLQKIFLVYEQESEIVGYIKIDTEQEMTKESKPIWFQEHMEPLYFSSPHAVIAPIAVSPTAKHKGVGTALVQEAIKRIKQRQDILYLFSFVVLFPIINTSSILFHEKCEFDRIAVTSYLDACELKPYQSVLYGKRL